MKKFNESRNYEIDKLHSLQSEMEDASKLIKTFAKLVEDIISDYELVLEDVEYSIKYDMKGNDTDGSLIIKLIFDGNVDAKVSDFLKKQIKNTSTISISKNVITAKIYI